MGRSNVYPRFRVVIGAAVGGDVAVEAVASADSGANVYFAVVWAIASLAVWRIRPGRAPSKVLEAAPRWGRGLRQKPWLFVALMVFAGWSLIGALIGLFQSSDAAAAANHASSLAFYAGLTAVLHRLKGWPDPEEAGN